MRDLDLAVAPGEIYGFLGQNGAGQTTTLRMFAGLLRPSAGELRIDGLTHADAGRALRRRIGFLPDTPPLHDYLTARQHLAFGGLAMAMLLVAECGLGALLGKSPAQVLFDRDPISGPAYYVAVAVTACWPWWWAARHSRGGASFAKQSD